MGRQTGVQLGGRLKAAWEWAAVLGQVEVYGWQKLDIRYYMHFRVRSTAGRGST